MPSRRSPLWLPQLLIVAKGSDLSRSLQFALRAEGFEVTSVEDVASAHKLPSTYACTVADHHALGSDTAVAADFCQTFAPVVLLANETPHPLSPWTFRTVQKPLLGEALSQAVRAAVQLRANPT